VVGTVSPTGPHPPKVGRKHDDRQKEEDSGDFEPQDAAHTAKGTQEAAHAMCDASARLDRGLGGCLRGRLNPNCCVSNWLDLRCSGGLCRRRQPLAHHAAGDAQACAKHPADLLWFHSVYDGSSDAG